MTLFYLSYSNITELPALPEGTTQLDLIGCVKLTKLPDLPAGIASLHLESCFRLTTLPNLPAGITSLHLASCFRLAELHDLPVGITSLNLRSCFRLATLPDLPAGITSLNLENCSGLAKLPDLPVGITSLYLANCFRLAELPDLPVGITSLNLKGCTRLAKLPKLPEGIINLHLESSRLTTLPDLPAGITNLCLENCSGLVTLPDLPAGITNLDLEGCSGLVTLPDLPAGITNLYLEGCNNLSLEILPQLQELEQRGVAIRYPIHLDPRQTQSQASTDSRARLERLYAVISRHTQQQEVGHSGAPNIKILLQRFLFENLGARGALPLTQVDSVLELFEQNPKNLKWAEEIATRYLEGCVNQPVNGWMEISAAAHIAAQDTWENKIIAARYLITFDIIKQSITDLEADKKPGKALEVEFGNAMIKIIHNKLLQNGNINEAWPGIPDGVAYVDSITRFLSKKTIADIYEAVIDRAFNREPREIETDLRTIHGDTWRQINHTPEIKATEEEYDEALKILSIAAGWIEDEDEHSPKAIERQDMIKELQSLSWGSNEYIAVHEALKKEREQKLSEATPTLSAQRCLPEENKDYLAMLRRLKKSLAPRAASANASEPAQAAAFPEGPAPSVVEQEGRNLDTPAERDINS